MLSLAIASVIVLVAFVVRGFSGFGSALVMTPLLALVFDPKQAVVTTAVLGATVGAGIAIQSRRDADRATLRRLLVVAIPGIVLGSLLLALANDGPLRKGLGAIVIVFGLRILLGLRTGSRQAPRWPAGTGYFAGGLSGILGGAFGTGGPPMVVYLENQLDSRSTLRATVLLGVLALDVTRVISYSATGVITEHALFTSLAMLPAALAGAVIGSRMHVGVSDRTFRATLGSFLLISGFLLLVQ